MGVAKLTKERVLQAEQGEILSGRHCDCALSLCILLCDSKGERGFSSVPRPGICRPCCNRSRMVLSKRMAGCCGDSILRRCTTFAHFTH